MSLSKTIFMATLILLGAHASAQFGRVNIFPMGTAVKLLRTYTFDIHDKITPQQVNFSNGQYCLLSPSGNHVTKDYTSKVIFKNDVDDIKKKEDQRRLLSSTSSEKDSAQRGDLWDGVTNMWNKSAAGQACSKLSDQIEAGKASKNEGGLSSLVHYDEPNVEERTATWNIYRAQCETELSEVYLTISAPTDNDVSLECECYLKSKSPEYIIDAVKSEFVITPPDLKDLKVKEVEPAQKVKHPVQHSL